jgi:Acyl-protein synthetase, LuxE
MTSSARSRDELRRLTDKVASFIRRADEGQTGEPELDAMALEVFAFQFDTIEPYRNLCRRVGRTPDEVRSWRGIPAVPAQAFKQYTLFAGAEAVATFQSSGTSEVGRTSRAQFTRAGLDLMDLAVAANARRSLFPDGRRTRILVMTPPPDKVPTMIMVRGMAHLIAAFGLEGSRFLAGPGGVDPQSVWDELSDCQRDGVPVSLLGSSFGFVHFFDWMERERRRLTLPEGSRLMDAGGYKGRSREIGRDQFVTWASSMIGVPPSSVVNLLGMTEMASQIYDQIDRRNGGARMKVAPAWVRSEVVDPRRVAPDGPEPLADGAVGLLRHFDLANVERPAMIQSEDLGRPVTWTRGGSPVRGFEILGRVKGAEPRGCSLTADDRLAPRPGGYP